MGLNFFDQLSIFRNLNFLLTRKKQLFVEFKVHLIPRKQVPLLHNTVLILCYGLGGLVGVMTLYVLNFAIRKLSLFIHVRLR